MCSSDLSSRRRGLRDARGGLGGDCGGGRRRLRASAPPAALPGGRLSVVRRDAGPDAGARPGGAHLSADRYTDVPLLGIYWILAFAGGEVAARSRVLRSVVVAVGVLTLGVWGAATFRQAQVWRDSMTLFQHALRSGCDSPLVRVNLGLALLEEQRSPEAREIGRAHV